MAINTRMQAPATTTDKPTARTVELPKLNLNFGASVGDHDRKFFTEQMALLLETGTPLLQSLQALRKQLDNPKMVELVETPPSRRSTVVRNQSSGRLAQA